MKEFLIAKIVEQNGEEYGLPLCTIMAKNIETAIRFAEKRIGKPFVVAENL